MPQDPDDNDAYSGYRPDMDQHPEPRQLDQMKWHWWMTVALIGGTIFWILVGIWLFT